VRRRTLTSSFFSDHSIIVLNFSSLTFILFGSVLLCRTTGRGLALVADFEKLYYQLSPKVAEAIFIC
uniref:hypothetical protein n=1 Tax=Riemerella anatipestifer TaxID=34085 RepID=UPI0030BE7CDE